MAIIHELVVRVLVGVGEVHSIRHMAENTQMSIMALSNNGSSIHHSGYDSILP